MKKHFSLTWRQVLLLGCVILFSALLFWNPKSQSPSWIFPYFSGAVNLQWDCVWRIDRIGIKEFADKSYVQQMGYWFVRADVTNLATYSVLDKGYVFVIWFAQNLFFWLPQIKAVIWFQIFFHIISSLWVLGWLENRRQQIIFFIAYAVNPVVLHFVTFAFYYYLQVIPPLAWFWFMTREDLIVVRDIYLLALLLGGAFLIRQSTAIVSVFILSYVAWKHKRVLGWGALVCFFVFVMIAKNPSQPWHTAYVGIGAYPNNADIEMDDESGYRMFKNTTGILINTTPPDGNYYDEGVRRKYYEVLQQRLIHYSNEHPLQLIHNAALNILQGFSVGYPVGHLRLAYVSALLGLIFLAILLLRKMYVMATLIFASVAGFVAYYPPIPAYMFGNYLLLSLALSTMVDQMCNSSRVVDLSHYLKERLTRLP